MISSRLVNWSSLHKDENKTFKNDDLAAPLQMSDGYIEGEDG